MSSQRIVIVGGVAGGATAAAHARRLSEDAEILIFERGPYVSFANCGLPYYIGEEIEDRESLLVQTPEGLHRRFNLDVRVNSEVVSIDPAARQVEVRQRETGEVYRERYDHLILSTGAGALKPPIPGIERPGHFTVRGIPDVEAILEWTTTRKAERAVVVGGGFIGLEMAEQLRGRGMQVDLVEALPQVMAPLDLEMAAWLQQELRSHEVRLHLNEPVQRFDAPGEDETAQASVVALKSGRRLPADLVILALGVRPETHLAKEAGVRVGDLGGIRVNEFLQTSDPHIWAVGDAIEVRHWVTGEWTLIPLAGPANRQGRIVTENIFGASLKFEGVLGTSIVRVFEMTAAATGASEKTLQRLQRPYGVVHLHPAAHATYYPGAHRLAMKVMFDPGNGTLLGAQVVGKEGVDKRIDVLATALKARMTVHDLEELELAYAPPFGAAKDPVNLAGMVAQHVVHHDIGVVQWHEVSHLDPKRFLLLDVRDAVEREEGTIAGSLHLPLPELRERVEELPRDKEIVAFCQTGQRSYFACRFLAQKGFRVRNLSGSYRTWQMATREQALASPPHSTPGPS